MKKVQKKQPIAKRLDNFNEVMLTVLHIACLIACVVILWQERDTPMSPTEIIGCLYILLSLVVGIKKR